MEQSIVSDGATPALLGVRGLTSRTIRSPWAVGGFCLIAIAVLANEWLLARLFSPDGVLHPLNRDKIRLFDLTLALAGFLSITVQDRLAPATLVRRLLRRPWRAGAVLSMICLMSTIGLVEWICGRLMQGPPVLFIAPDYPAVADADLGFRGKPSITRRVRKQINDAVVYDHAYSTDEKGWRVTPAPTQPASRFLAFFGCSFAFGEGVDDDQTLPAQTQFQMPGVRAYNFAYRSYGPQQTLALLQQDGVLRGILREPEGVGVYLFMDGHIQRAIGSMWVTAWWGKNMPYYHFDGRGSLVRDGDFESGRPLRWRAHQLLAASNIVRYFGVDFPTRIDSSHRDVTAAILIEADRAFRSRFPGSPFVVALYPWSKEASEIGARLRAAHVKVLDYSHAFDEQNSPGEQLVIPWDGHPSALAHQRLASRLARDLLLLQSP